MKTLNITTLCGFHIIYYLKSRLTQNLAVVLMLNILTAGILAAGNFTEAKSPGQFSAYYVEDLDLVTKNLSVVGPNTSSSRFVGQTQIKQYVDVLEMNLDGATVFALSYTYGSYYTDLPFVKSFVRLRPLSPNSLQEQMLRDKVPELLALDSERELFVLDNAISIDSLISVTGKVEACTRTSTSRIHSTSQDSFCVGEHLLPELADYLGENVTVLLKPTKSNPKTQCTWLQNLTDSKGCRLKTTDFIAEVRQGGLVLVQNYINEFKGMDDGKIFEHFPIRASAPGLTD